jgi:hypothetical protein
LAGKGCRLDFHDSIVSKGEAFLGFEIFHQLYNQCSWE